MEDVDLETGIAWFQREGANAQPDTTQPGVGQRICPLQALEVASYPGTRVKQEGEVRKHGQSHPSWRFGLERSTGASELWAGSLG